MTEVVIQTFRDTTEPENLPIDSSYQGVFAYANGKFAWPQAQVNRFADAGKHLYRIDVLGNDPHGASILDVERGDATPATAKIWVPERNAIEDDAMVYVSLDNVSSVLDACRGDKLWLFVADFTGQPHVPNLPPLPSGVKLAAVQYATNALYDSSAIFSSDWLAGRPV
jgi:hypothetical protein